VVQRLREPFLQSVLSGERLGGGRMILGVIVRVAQRRDSLETRGHKKGVDEVKAFQKSPGNTGGETKRGKIAQGMLKRHRW
jgi:hypothetical protein